YGDGPARDTTLDQPLPAGWVVQSISDPSLCAANATDVVCSYGTVAAQTHNVGIVDVTVVPSQSGPFTSELDASTSSTDAPDHPTLSSPGPSYDDPNTADYGFGIGSLFPIQTLHVGDQPYFYIVGQNWGPSYVDNAHVTVSIASQFTVHSV